MSEWKPFHDPYRRVSDDAPWRHDWIEVRRDGELVGRRVRFSDMSPAMNVAGLRWRPSPPTGDE